MGRAGKLGRRPRDQAAHRQTHAQGRRARSRILRLAARHPENLRRRRHGKKNFLDRLDPDCLEALDFNLSAGRHKPFVFDAGQHRPARRTHRRTASHPRRSAEATRETAHRWWKAEKIRCASRNVDSRQAIGHLPNQPARESRSWQETMKSRSCPWLQCQRFSGTIISAATRPLRDINRVYAFAGDILYAKITSLSEQSWHRPHGGTVQHG